MQATNFNETLKGKVDQLLEFAIRNRYSNFYKNKYQGQAHKRIDSYDDFRNLPILTKDEIVTTDLRTRTFVPEEEIFSYNISSGTTGSNKPTIIPQLSPLATDDPKINLDEILFKKLGVHNLLLLLKPLTPGLLKILSYPRQHTAIVPGDVTNLKLTAQIAQQTGIQAIMASPTLLDLFLKELQALDYDFKTIKWLNIGGEYCSAQKAEYFKSIFTEAYFQFRYFLSEANLIGYRCDELALHEKPNKLHLASTALVEIVDENLKTVPLGEIGQIIYTRLEKTAMPIIRYKTNDVGSLSTQQCACGHEYLLTLGGRTDFDSIRFYGINLYSQMIENSLDGLRQYFEPRFQLHIFEELSDNALKPKLQLHLKLNGMNSHLAADPYFNEMVKRKISEQLWVSAKSHLQDLVRQNFFLPLELVLIESWPPGDKSKNIISHLN